MRHLHESRRIPGAMAGFPNIIRSLPEADHPFRDIALWLLRGPTASLIFVEASADSVVPEHSHGAQWGVVVSGDLVLTIGGRTRTYHAGEEYFIPAGVPHAAKLRAGVRVIDTFDAWRPSATTFASRSHSVTMPIGTFAGDMTMTKPWCSRAIVFAASRTEVLSEKERNSLSTMSLA